MEKVLYFYCELCLFWLFKVEKFYNYVELVFWKCIWRLNEIELEVWD